MITNPVDLGSVLAVFAHPDDEAYVAGGIMAACADAGHRVTCVTATRGELGTSDPETWPPERLAALRERELKACLDVLGAREHHWLGYADGGCADADPEPAVRRLVELLDELRPDSVLTFGPDGGTWHPDHIASCEWTTEAVRRSGGGARLYYAAATPELNEQMRQYVDLDLVMMADKPPPETDPADLAVHVRLEGAALDRKVRALRCQESQVAPMYDMVGPEVFALLVRDEPFVLA